MEKIPALTLSGGKLSEFEGKVVVYRIWVHPREGGDDGYLEFGPNEIEKAKNAHKVLLQDIRFSIVEPIIAIVFDSRYKKYREVAIDQKEGI